MSSGNSATSTVFHQHLFAAVLVAEHTYVGLAAVSRVHLASALAMKRITRSMRRA